MDFGHTRERVSDLFQNQRRPRQTPLIGLTTCTSTVMSTAMTKNDAVTLEALPHEFEPSRSNTD
jgi:hypothetical protein